MYANDEPRLIRYESYCHNQFLSCTGKNEIKSQIYWYDLNAREQDLLTGYYQIIITFLIDYNNIMITKKQLRVAYAASGAQ